MHKLFTTLIFLLTPLMLIGQTNLIKNAGLENNSVSGENIPHNSEIDVPLNYADYYFLEALTRKRDLEKI